MKIEKIRWRDPVGNICIGYTYYADTIHTFEDRHVGKSTHFFKMQMCNTIITSENRLIKNRDASLEELMDAYYGIGDKHGLKKEHNQTSFKTEDRSMDSNDS